MNTLLSTTSPTAGLGALLRWSSVAVVGSLLAACSGGDPPEVCTGEDAIEIPSSIELKTGQERLVDYCFTDPEGAKLTITTQTTDEEVAIALVYGWAVLAVAQGPGQATITITAEDPGGNTKSVEFDVIVPNQLPFAAGDWPKIKLLTDQTMELFVDDFFRDADGDPLFYTAASEDPAIATVVREDSVRIVINALTAGETHAVLTAEDPHGGTAELRGYIRVVEPVLFWRDDFDENTYDFSYNYFTVWSYIDHNVLGDDYENPGYLAVHNRNGWGYFFISGFRNALDNGEHWMVRMRLGSGSTATNQALGFWGTMLDITANIRWFIGTVGDVTQFAYIRNAVVPSNWQVWGCCGYHWLVGGESDAVNVVGEFNEMEWGVQRGQMSMTVNGTLVHSEDPEGKYPRILQQSRLFGYAGGGESGPNQMSYFDWAELWAIDAFDDAGDLSGGWYFEDDASPLTTLSPAEIQQMNLIAQ